jgi:site-specific DNA-cytosine methylase
MNARDDFGGAGGAHVGLVAAGFDVDSFDHWPVAVATQQANGHRAHVLDLSVDDPPAPESPWLLWASPPCQPFSAAGDGAGEDDPRDGIQWWLRILGAQLPEVAVMENVKGLTFEKHSPYLARVLRQVHEFGYRYEWRVLNCADYGIPQTRERFILIARRDGGPIVWPTVTHTEEPGLFTERWVSMADALGWDGEVRPNSNRTDPRPRHLASDGPAPTVMATTGKSNLLVDRPASTIVGNRRSTEGGLVGRQLPPGQGRNVGGKNRVDTRTLRPGIVDNRNRSVVPVERPAPTIALGNDVASWVWERKNVHLRTEADWPHTRPATSINSLDVVSAPGWHDPTVSGSQQADAIPVTIPELAALQDFPAGYIFCGTKTDQARQIGNAVPATLARLIAEGNRPL